MKQLRLWKESLKSERDQKAAHWDYAPPKQNLTLPETAPQPSKDWSPKLNSDPAPRSKNYHTEEQIDALLKRGIATVMETARADSLLAEDNLNKLKLAIIKDLTASQARPNEQDSESPEHQRTREKPLTLPRRASKSPDRSRAREVVDYQPLNGRTSRSPTQRKPTYAKDLSGRREGSPSGYRVDRHINLDRDHTRICAINRFWRINRNPVTKRMILFNALFSGERIRNIEEPYAKTEEFAFFRDDALHPFYPYEDDELTLWTRNTSGIEVLHSVLIPRHPTRFTHLHVFSCTTKYWLVPVIKERIKANTMAHYLAAKLRPFYSEGKGEIMCPVCISYIIAERFWPVRFTRREFMAQSAPEEVHQAFEGTAYLGFATGYSTHMYEAQIIYSYCLANSHRDVTEDKSADPFSGTKISELEGKSPHVDSTYGVFFVTLLKDLFERTDTVFASC
jgi:hypothetical protein